MQGVEKQVHAFVFRHLAKETEAIPPVPPMVIRRAGKRRLAIFDDCDELARNPPIDVALPQKFRRRYEHIGRFKMLLQEMLAQPEILDTVVGETQIAVFDRFSVAQALGLILDHLSVALTDRHVFVQCQGDKGVR